MTFVSRLAGTSEEPVAEAIARNLEAVLNARAGYAGAVEVFGLGRYDAWLADKDLVAALTSEMTEQVRRYEPRLQEPQVTLRGKDRGLWVVFSLRGRVDKQTRSYAVLFHSVFRNVRVLYEAG
jgi:type VI secretion system protein